MSELQRNEKQLSTIEIRLKQPFHGLFAEREKRLKQEEYDDLNDKQTEACAKYLQANDKEYQRFHMEILKLFSRKSIRFKVYQTGLANRGGYGTRFTGRIHENGYSYLDVQETMGMGLFGAMQYPKRIEGKIDQWGKIELHTVETAIAFANNLPDIIEGSIDDQGNIRLETISCTSDIGGSGIISKLIADHFGHQPLHREVFLKMRALLIGKISKLRKELASQQF